MKKHFILLVILLTTLIHSHAAFWSEDGYRDLSWYDKYNTHYEISTPAQMGGLLYLANQGETFKGKTITLTDNINLGRLVNGKNVEWRIIKEFDGVLDGNGFEISGIINHEYNVTTSSEGNVKISIGNFINKIGENGIVKNLALPCVLYLGLTIDKTSTVIAGAFALENYGCIDNCVIIKPQISGNIYSKADNVKFYIGSMVGCNYGQIRNIVTSDKLGEDYLNYYIGGTNNFMYVGRMIGNNSGTIKNCGINYMMFNLKYSNLSNVTVADYPSIYIGGIYGTGNKDGVIENCYSFYPDTQVYYKYEGNLGWSSNCAKGDLGWGSGSIRNCIVQRANNVHIYKSITNDNSFTITSADTSPIVDYLNRYINKESDGTLLPWFASSGNYYTFNDYFIKFNIGKTGQRMATFFQTNPKIGDHIGVSQWGVRTKKAETFRYEDTFTEFGKNEIYVKNLDPAEKYVGTYIVKMDNDMIYEVKSVDFETLSTDILISEEASDITANSATINGKIDKDKISASKIGFFVREETENEFIEYKTSDKFSLNLENLMPSRTYFYYAYAISNIGETIKGKTLNFSTKPVRIELDKDNSKGVGTTLLLYGTLNLRGARTIDIHISEYGSSQSEIYSIETSNNGKFSGIITDLKPNQKYEVTLSVVYNSEITKSSSYLLSTTDASDTPENGMDEIFYNREMDVYSQSGILLKSNIKWEDVRTIFPKGIYILKSDGFSRKAKI